MNPRRLTVLIVLSLLLAAIGGAGTRSFAQTPAPTPTSTVPSSPPPGITVTYPAGWNLVALPGGTDLSRLAGPVYTLQPGDSSYQTVQTAQGTVTGYGYWAFFSNATSLPLAAGSAGYSVLARPGQFIMIGNPSGNEPATVSGADAVYVFDAARGSYQPATLLQPGEGAWALSYSGGTISLASAATAGTLSVTVQFAFAGGAPPQAGTPSQASLEPAAGVEVEAAPAGNGQAAPLATTTTDQSGAATLTLPPGSYWVFVPSSAANGPGIPSAVIQSRLPDGTVVLGWAPANVVAGGSTTATITIPVAVP